MAVKVFQSSGRCPGWGLYFSTGMPPSPRFLHEWTVSRRRIVLNRVWVPFRCQITVCVEMQSRCRHRTLIPGPSPQRRRAGQVGWEDRARARGEGVVAGTPRAGRAEPQRRRLDKPRRRLGQCLRWGMTSLTQHCCRRGRGSCPTRPTVLPVSSGIPATTHSNSPPPGKGFMSGQFRDFGLS